jgi:glyoxylase I family protein
MQFSQIQHCSIAVTDLDRAAAFYRDVMGLTEIMIPPTFPPAGVNVRWFSIGGQQIHLLINTDENLTRPGHMALQVDDAKAARAYFKSKGMEILETVLIPDTDRFFINDSDGNQLEIIEWQKPYPAIPVKG